MNNFKQIRRVIAPRPADVITNMAAVVIDKADRSHPADAVLRHELSRTRGVSRDQGRIVAKAVFAYFRWQGWIDPEMPIELAIDRAKELETEFRKHPEHFPDEDLPKAIPAWLPEFMKITPEWLRGIQRPPSVWLRAKQGLAAEIAPKLPKAKVAFLPDAIQYDGEIDLFRSKEFQAGQFEIQDLGSQAVGLMCNPRPGESWWDACAGEGGKTLHLCDLMKGKGQVWATDRADWRLQKLKQRTARASVFNYRVSLWDGGEKLPTDTKFDGILVDAPCSGIGTWQRNPQARWTTKERDVTELSEVQKKLVANVIPALKPGGRLIYSVCTLTPAETTEVLAFIQKSFPELEPVALSNPLNPAAAPVEQLWLLPQDNPSNGMFICAWRRPKEKTKSK